MQGHSCSWLLQLAEVGLLLVVDASITAKGCSTIAAPMMRHLCPRGLILIVGWLLQIVLTALLISDIYLK